MINRYPSIQRVLDKADQLFDQPIPVNNGKLVSSALSHHLYLGDRFYTIGIGGLHSVDGDGSWEADDKHDLIDIDVASYYPAIMLTQKYGPRHWGDKFQEVYKSIVDRRLVAKRSGDKTTAAVLKIVANGTYGKTADVYSSLFDPWVTVHVTVTGQLALLVLIAMLHDRGITTVSANTDGLTVLAPKPPGGQRRPVVEVVEEWENLTGFEMEYTQYSKVMQLDVNNYIALTTDGKLKTKGRFQAPQPGHHDLRHSPNFNICALAIQEYIKTGRPLESSIYACSDINQFILTQQVKGNWTTSWRGNSLGKMLRWYKSTREDAAPIYRHPGEDVKGNEGVVANSNSAIPLENLPDEFPGDMDYNWYIETAQDWLTRMSRAKIEGINRKAQEVIEQGLHPVIMDLDSKRRSRARPPIGTVDFSSMTDDQVLGVMTGRGVIARVDSHNQTLGIYKTDRDYPSKTRPKILKDHRFELVYGGAVRLGTVFKEIEGNWEGYYTEAEMNKVVG